MKKYLKQAGFSLAELLVTMGILGVLAVMLLPTLKGNYESHVMEAQAKASYNIIKQAVQNSPNYGTLYVKAEPEVWFNKYIKSNIKLAKDCGKNADCWQNDFKTLNEDGIYIGGEKYSFSLLNGTNVIIMQTRSSRDLNVDYGVNQLYEDEKKPGLVLHFDVNGEAPPNIIGLDIYTLGWTGKELVPAGSSWNTERVKNNCSNSGEGYACLQYMMDNGWKINKKLFE